jgi:topoisomerase-4 subunit B
LLWPHQKVVYQNEEFNLFFACVEHRMASMIAVQSGRHRYGCRCGWHAYPVVVADLLSSVFPELREGHLFILDTPLFRVRDKQKLLLLQ